MTFRFAIEDLLAYTEWDRAQWHAWFTNAGPEALAVGLGPNSDGKIKNVGELVRHIFGAEWRYVDRIRGAEPRDLAAVPADDVEALFALGRESRQAMRALLNELPSERWDATQELRLGPNARQLTLRTMVAQSITHEIRHWAQIAMLLRMDGRKTGTHDFLISGVYESRLATAR